MERKKKLLKLKTAANKQAANWLKCERIVTKTSHLVDNEESKEKAIRSQLIHLNL